MFNSHSIFYLSGCRAQMGTSKFPSPQQQSPWCTVSLSWWSAQRWVIWWSYLKAWANGADILHTIRSLLVEALRGRRNIRSIRLSQLCRGNSSFISNLGFNFRWHSSYMQVLILRVLQADLTPHYCNNSYLRVILTHFVIFLAHPEVNCSFHLWKIWA